MPWPHMTTLMPMVISQSDQATYAKGTMVAATDQPALSLGPTNSSVPINSAPPIGKPSQPSYGATVVVDTIEVATTMVHAPVSR